MLREEMSATEPASTQLPNPQPQLQTAQAPLHSPQPWSRQAEVEVIARGACHTGGLSTGAGPGVTGHGLTRQLRWNPKCTPTPCSVVPPLTGRPRGLGQHHRQNLRASLAMDTRVGQQ